MSKLTKLSDKVVEQLTVIFDEQEIDRTDYNPNKHPKIDEIKSILKEFGKEVTQLDKDSFKIELHNLISKGNKINGAITQGKHPGLSGLMRQLIADCINESIVDTSQRAPLICILTDMHTILDENRPKDKKLIEEHYPITPKDIEAKMVELESKSTPKMKR